MVDVTEATQGKLTQRCDKHDIPIEELSCSRAAPCVVCGEVVGGIDGPRGHTRWASEDSKYVLRLPSGWISTKECFPPDGKQVLVWFEGEREIRFAYFHRELYLQDCYWWCDSGEWRPNTFSHWRPLPEPP